MRYRYFSDLRFEGCGRFYGLIVSTNYLPMETGKGGVLKQNYLYQRGFGTSVLPCHVLTDRYQVKNE